MKKKNKRKEKEDKILEKIDSLRKRESHKILYFLTGLFALTFLLLVFLVGLFGEPRAWQLYFFGIFLMVLWLALRLLELEAEIEELQQKLGKNLED